MNDHYVTHLRDILGQIRADGFEKKERVISSPQSPEIELQGGARVLNFCANNYLGLANDPRLVGAARDGLVRYGFGLASVRFICGTQSVHTALEAAPRGIPRGPTRPSCTAAVSTRTAACSRRCSEKRTP